MSIALSVGQTNELLFLGFNQDHGCFAVGTDTGFRIYNCEPFKETFRRDSQSGGIGIVEMLFRCNILAVVGGGKSPRYPPNKVMIWDDHQNRCIGELTFRSDVKGVKLRRDRVVVILEHKIYVYNFADLKLLSQIDTVQNPMGLAALCPSSNHTVLACPGLHKGHVRIELYDRKKTQFVAAHESDLQALSLNMDGLRLATASEKGTLVRIWDTVSGSLLQELRRGVDRAEIYCICFNFNSQWLAVSSDKDTVHIFALENEESNAVVPGSSNTTNSSSVDNSLTSNASNSNSNSSTDNGGTSNAGVVPNSADNNDDNIVGMSSEGGSGTIRASPEPVAKGQDGGNASAEQEKNRLEKQRQKEVELAGEANKEPDSIRNPGSSFSFMKSLLPKYFSSEWSFAQFRVNDEKTLCAFGSQPNTLIVISADGCFYKCSFDPHKGGECTRELYHRFLKEDDR